MQVVRTIKIKVPDLEQKIRNARFDAKKKGVHLKDICSELGMTTSNWYLIEKGVTQEVSEELLKKIEKILEADLGINFNVKRESLCL